MLEDTVVRFSPERFKHWRVKFNSQKEAFGSRPPKLRFGWLPEKVRFLARGKTPFLISYGSARIGPIVGLNLQDSARTFSGSIGPALVSHQSVLGGESKLTYTPPQVHPWKSWILWAVLLIGVLGLAKMALSVTKSLQNEEHSK